LVHWSIDQHQVVRNYLEWLLDLPWGVVDQGSFDVEAVKRQLDEDHYGLEKVAPTDPWTITPHCMM
jgi:ATP-dependent Lon protease